MKLFRQLLLREESDQQISTGELRHVEKYLNAVWKHLGIDFEFTKHFFERVNDPRNGKQIEATELVKIFTDVYKKYGAMISKKVTPDTEKKFDSVLTDLSTKVNSPVVVVWNREKHELEMIAKTVMRVNHFYNHPDQTRLTVQQYEPQGAVITEKKMKTYRDITEWVGWNTPEVAPIATPQAVDDVDSAAFSVEKPEILEKLNAYCHDIANHQYINPYYPLNTLWKKLMLIGVNFDLKKIMLMGEQGRTEVPINMFGGRFGALGDPSTFISQDDGVKDRVPGGLNLVVTYQKTGGVYTLDATIERGMTPRAIGFGEEIVTEDERYKKPGCAGCGKSIKNGAFCKTCREDRDKNPQKYGLKKKIVEDELTETNQFTHKIWTGPTGAKEIAGKLHKHYPNTKAGTEHVYVHTNHSADHVRDTLKNKLGMSGFSGAQGWSTHTHSPLKKK